VPWGDEAKQQRHRITGTTHRQPQRHNNAHKRRATARTTRQRRAPLKRWTVSTAGTLANHVGTVARVRAWQTDNAPRQRAPRTAHAPCMHRRTDAPRTAPTRTLANAPRMHRACTDARRSPLPETKRARAHAPITVPARLARPATIRRTNRTTSGHHSP
jgi:hypothetical protein